MSACKKHAESPVIGYNPCPGCEVEGLRAQHGRDSAELRSLSQARDDARKERDQLKAEIESLRKDAERFRHLMFNHVDWARNGKDDDLVVLEFGPYPSHKLRDSIDAAMSKGDQP